tara:strand:+ start:141 stop:788 length:648 start_codon:yes stop_codon:yes gene_type:complete
MTDPYLKAYNKRDSLTIAYDTAGAIFRNTPQGKLLKFIITNNLTKSARDKLLKSQPEHVKRYIQYLTGGTVDNKTITQLPDKVRKEVIEAHLANQYPERQNEFLLKDGYYGKKGDPNPKYNPKSNLLKLYNKSPETHMSLGHVQFTPNEQGGYTLTDTYKVDESNHKPLRGFTTDLVEGGAPAAYAYDISKFLGINKNLKYNVKFPRKDLQIEKK